MATNAVGPQQVRARREMVEATAPEMFQFTKEGQIIGGVLISIEPTKITDKKTGEEKAAIEYMLANEKGERITFLGMNDLNKKIVPGHIGHWMDIRYERNDSSFVKPGQSPAKIFKVLVAKEKEPGF
jgi:hypothetical protein